jgi:alpha-1,2-mannosyltransferase
VTALAGGSARPGRRQERERATERLLLGVAPAALTAWLVFAALRFHWVAFDFYRAYYPAAHRLLHGGSPYAVTHQDVVAGTAFVYPALSAVAFAPFALVGRGLSQHLYMLLCLTMVPGALWAMRVRDWRVYGVVLLWFPMIIGWQGENISVPLMLLLALAWRYRDRPVTAGLVTAVAISLKPFFWPLGLWLLATRRWRAAAWAFGWGLLVNLLAWGIVGFDEIHAYLRLSGQVTDALWRGGYSMLAVAGHLGFGRGVGEVLLVAVSAAVGVALIYKGFVKRQDREAMALAVALMLVASPLVWVHYFVLLLVPIALARPRFGVIWVAPIAMWALPPGTTVAGWELALAWAVTLACLAPALITRPRRRSAGPALGDPPRALQILSASS